MSCLLLKNPIPEWKYAELSMVSCNTSADSLHILYFGSVLGEVLALFCAGLPAVALAKAGGVCSQQWISLPCFLSLSSKSTSNLWLADYWAVRVLPIILSVFNRENTGNLFRWRRRLFDQNGITLIKNKVFSELYFSAGIQEQGMNRELGSLILYCWKGRCDFWP